MSVSMSVYVRACDVHFVYKNHSILLKIWNRKTENTSEADRQTDSRNDIMGRKKKLFMKLVDGVKVAKLIQPKVRSENIYFWCLKNCIFFRFFLEAFCGLWL